MHEIQQVVPNQGGCAAHGGGKRQVFSVYRMRRATRLAARAPAIGQGRAVPNAGERGFIWQNNAYGGDQRPPQR